MRQKDASLRGSVTQLWEQAVLDRIHAPVYEKSERVFVFVAFRVAPRGQALCGSAGSSPVSGFESEVGTAWCDPRTRAE